MGPSKCLACPSSAPLLLGRRSFLGTGAAGLAFLAFPSACGSSTSGVGDDAGGLPDVAGGDSAATDSARPSDARSDTTQGTDAGIQDATADTEMVVNASDASACSPTCAGDAATTLTLPFSVHPGLATAGGSILVQDARYKDPVCNADFVMVAHPAAGQYVAFSGSCTHRCCQVMFTGTSFACPCHGSTYNLAGQVTGGPAPLALQQLQVCADDCGVYVQLP